MNKNRSDNADKPANAGCEASFGIILNPKSGQVLLVESTKHKGLHLIGGRTEAIDRDTVHTLVREMDEEISIGSATKFSDNVAMIVPIGTVLVQNINKTASLNLAIANFDAKTVVSLDRGELSPRVLTIHEFIGMNTNEHMSLVLKTGLPILQKEVLAYSMSYALRPADYM